VLHQKRQRFVRNVAKKQVSFAHRHNGRCVRDSFGCVVPNQNIVAAKVVTNSGELLLCKACCEEYTSKSAKSPRPTTQAPSAAGAAPAVAAPRPAAAAPRPTAGSEVAKSSPKVQAPTPSVAPSSSASARSRPQQAPPTPASLAAPAIPASVPRAPSSSASASTSSNASSAAAAGEVDYKAKCQQYKTQIKSLIAAINEEKERVSQVCRARSSLLFSNTLKRTKFHRTNATANETSAARARRRGESRTYRQSEVQRGRADDESRGTEMESKRNETIGNGAFDCHRRNGLLIHLVVETRAQTTRQSNSEVARLNARAEAAEKKLEALSATLRDELEHNQKMAKQIVELNDKLSDAQASKSSTRSSSHDVCLVSFKNRTNDTQLNRRSIVFRCMSSTVGKDGRAIERGATSTRHGRSREGRADEADRSDAGNCSQTTRICGEIGRSTRSKVRFSCFVVCDCWFECLNLI
jgi:hypothetical protein